MRILQPLLSGNWWAYCLDTAPSHNSQTVKENLKKSSFFFIQNLIT